MIELLIERYKNTPIDFVVGIESRVYHWFCLAHQLNKGFIPIRKGQASAGSDCGRI